VASYFEKQIAEKEVLLVKKIQKSIAPISADRESLSRALINLLDNAIKYAPQSQKVILKAFSQNTFVFFEVEDFGPGIPKEEQSKVFNKFYRSEHSLGCSIKGSGIGLTLVAHTVQAHNGDVFLESEEGKRTKVTLKIPIKMERGNHG
jgi:two-component system phosphate regulon sensor histidine kinase PhoR